MHLIELGWDTFFQNSLVQEPLDQAVPARVSEQNRGLYRILAESGEYLAEVTGRVRHSAGSRSDFPAVGDWVIASLRPQERRSSILSILPRRTQLSRKVAGKAAEEQILAANLDIVFIVTSLNQDFNLRRIERYLALIWESGAKPVVLLNKSDLSSAIDSSCRMAESVAPGVPVHALSARTGSGIESVQSYLSAGKTAAFIGSSGVGKSSIINTLLGRSLLQARPVRSSDDRGRHTTTVRQMILLPEGGIVIDTPGMRELQLWDNTGGLAQAFDELESLAEQCRFRNCQHRGEPGCAVEMAVDQGSIDPARLENYRKMQAELEFLKSKTDIQAQQKRKKIAKQGSKYLKRHYQR